MKAVKTPVPSGEYAVGTFTYTVKDVREEVMAPYGMRSVAARVYYPVLKESVKDLPKIRYMSPDMAKGMKAVFKVAPKLDEGGLENTSECYENAPRISGMRFPLIVFNHGYNSFREGNSYLCIDLASHGYVVLSVTHTMEAICTELDDGSAVFFDRSIIRKMYDPMIGGLIAMYKLMKFKGSLEEAAEKFDEAANKYCRFLIDRTPEWVKDTDAAVEYAKNNLSDLIDFDKGIGCSGHSMGGNTAYALCTQNPDYVCGVNIDGSLFGDYKNTVLTKPFLQISCKDNERVVTRVYLKHTKPVYKVLFRDMRHIGFADSKYIMPMKSQVGKLAPDLMHDNLCKVHREFFDACLKGLKDRPEFVDNDVVKVSVFEPDMKEN
ncbi:MAG: hypothetical protein IKH20_05500 [Clostridiales bacterium]|nr:hypothetical protein [Clostridiales bacterium]